MSARRSPARWVRELDPTVSDALLAAGLTLLALPGLVVHSVIYSQLGRRDRRRAGGQRDHREDPRGQGADEAGPARPVQAVVLAYETGAVRPRPG